MISLVIPHMTLVPGIDHLLRKCVNSMSWAEQIIIVANEGMGYGPAVNLGLKLTTHKFIIVSNNDIEWKEGYIESLLDENAVTVPKIIPQPKDNNPRPFYCMPRHIYNFIYEKYGDWYDERFEMGYWEDDDLIMRLQESNIAMRYIPECSIHHLNGGGTTMKTVGEQKYYDENKERFMVKWGNEDNLQ